MSEIGDELLRAVTTEPALMAIVDQLTRTYLENISFELTSLSPEQQYQVCRNHALSGIVPFPQELPGIIYADFERRLKAEQPEAVALHRLHEANAALIAEIQRLSAGDPTSQLRTALAEQQRQQAGL